MKEIKPKIFNNEKMGKKNEEEKEEKKGKR